MATKMKTLIQGEDTILPRTVAKAVTMEDGTNLEAKMKNIGTESIKIPADVAEALGLAEGTDLSTILINQATNNVENTLAVAELIP